MAGFLIVLVVNVIGLVFLGLYMLYTAVLILFIVCTFPSAVGILAICDGLRPTRLQT